MHFTGQEKFDAITQVLAIHYTVACNVCIFKGFKKYKITSCNVPCV